MESILASIVIPVYNKGQYLKECLDSIQRQTYKNLEIICVDDGSTDNSYEICLEYTRTDKRFRIIKQKNSGAAAARNRGLDNAHGEYIVFLDADDSFDEKMIEKACLAATENNADVVVWGYNEVGMESNNTSVVCRIPNYEVVDHDEVDFEVMESARTVPWNKLVRRELLIRKAIRFQNIPTENDVFYSNAVILSASKIFFVREALVNYSRGLQGSISVSRTLKKSHALLAYDQVYQFIKENEEKFVVPYIDKTLDWIMGNIIKENNFVRVKSISENYKKCKALKNAFLENENNPSIKFRNRNLINLLKSMDLVNLPSNIYIYSMGILQQIVENAHRHNKKIALWGCGVKGKKFIDAMKECGIQIDYVVDMDKSKQGTLYKSYLIHNYLDIQDVIQIIIILTSSILEEISELSQNKEIIDFTKF
ncbi:MAG: glycosyltransferase family 2 protein [Lachnospiraceae bacterium]|nr:glycosyltransferase family 2 protein [Lachnospiraceae bacterium]